MNKKQISTSALLSNANFFKSYAPKICAVVKAEAYGHGMIEVAKTLQDSVDFFGVANLGEAKKLKSALPNAKIIILGKCEDFSFLKEFYLTAVSIADVKKAIKLNLTQRCFIKLCVGMNRFGIDCGSDNLLKKVKNLIKNHDFAGFSVHFSSISSQRITKKEYNRFLFAKSFLQKPFPVCFGGSGAKHLPCDILRVGIGLYGYGDKRLQSVMRLSSSVLQLRSLERGDSAGYDKTFVAKRKTTLAVVGVGYADGFDRKASKKLKVEIDGKRFRVVGNMCMDACFVDVTGGLVNVGDQVLMMKNAKILAKAYKKTEYEVLCAFAAFRGEIKEVE